MGVAEGMRTWTGAFAWSLRSKMSSTRAISALDEKQHVAGLVARRARDKNETTFKRG
jgi:hypothetical protein